jgi:hypothetical protein
MVALSAPDAAPELLNFFRGPSCCCRSVFKREAVLYGMRCECLHVLSLWTSPCVAACTAGGRPRHAAAVPAATAASDQAAPCLVFAACCQPGRSTRSSLCRYGWQRQLSSWPAAAGTAGSGTICTPRQPCRNIRHYNGPSGWLIVTVDGCQQKQASCSSSYRRSAAPSCSPRSYLQHQRSQQLCR